MKATEKHLERLGVAGGILLGGVLLVASWAKAIDPEAFAEQIGRRPRRGRFVDGGHGAQGRSYPSGGEA